MLDGDWQAVAARVQLPRALEQVDNLLAHVAANSSLGTRTDTEHVETWGARLGLVNSSQQLGFIQETLGHLVEFSPGPNGIAMRLTQAGWQRAEELRRQRGPGNQAFVAMWFHTAMMPAFKEGFEPALTDTGHKPYRIDLAAHNNKVDDEIIAEIRRSKILIVDVTGARPNAYFEAGFAMGLGIPVIWCCNDSWQGCAVGAAPNNTTVPPATLQKWTEVLAFDTRQHPFIFWQDPPDLRAKLRDRIRALGFDADWNRSS